MYVDLNVGLSYISDCQLFGEHCQRSSSMLLLIIKNCIGFLSFLSTLPRPSKVSCMIRHSMDVVRKAVEIIDPGQDHNRIPTFVHNSKADTMVLA